MSASFYGKFGACIGTTVDQRSRGGAYCTPEASLARRFDPHFLFSFFFLLFCARFPRVEGNARGWAMFPDVVVLVPNKELCDQVS